MGNENSSYFIDRKQGFIELKPSSPVLGDAVAVTNLMGHCYADDIDIAIIYEENLPDHFFDLKSGLAGEILQKFSTYRFRAVFIISIQRFTGRFAEMAMEENKKSRFHFCKNRDAALSFIRNTKT